MHRARSNLNIIQLFDVYFLLFPFSMRAYSLTQQVAKGSVSAWQDVPIPVPAFICLTTHCPRLMPTLARKSSTELLVLVVFSKTRLAYSQPVHSTF